MINRMTRREQWEAVRRLMREQPHWCSAILQHAGDSMDPEPRHETSATGRFCDALELWDTADPNAAPDVWRKAFKRAGLTERGTIPTELIPIEHLNAEELRQQID